MDRKFEFLSFMILLATGLLLPVSCGYYNPNALSEVRDLPPTRIHAPIWSNATSELGLESRAHNAVSDRLLESGRIVLVAAEEEAEYILTGRITSIRYPGFSYDIKAAARSLNAVMTCAVSLTERETGQIIWQNPSLRLEETYNLEDSVSQTDANQREALRLLVDRLADQVYLRVMRGLAAVSARH